MKIHDMTKSEMPREKAFKQGIKTLSNRELLSIILRCGYKGVSVLEMADNLLNEFNGLIGLSETDVIDMLKVKGISKVKALELNAVFELMKRIDAEKIDCGFLVDNLYDLTNYLNHKIGFKKQEHFIVMFLDNRNKLIKDEILFIGSLDASIVHPREIFAKAITFHCAKIIIAHNHPSGDCTPSEQDVLVTKNIEQAGQILGIPLIEHIIVSNNCHYSFKAKCLLL